jgi:hypothetical protein
LSDARFKSFRPNHFKDSAYVSSKRFTHTTQGWLPLFAVSRFLICDDFWSLEKSPYPNYDDKHHIYRRGFDVRD